MRRPAPLTHTSLRPTAVVLVLAMAVPPAAAQNQLWVQQLGSGTLDQVLASATDGAGGAYVGGITSGVLGASSAGGFDAWLARYDGAGSSIWIRQIGTVGTDFTYTTAPDGASGVFAAGATDGNLGGTSAGLPDAWLARYDSAGTQLWIRQLGTSATDEGYVSAEDGGSGVYVGGSTGGNLGGANAGLGDAWLARYDGAGNQLWIRQFGTSGIDTPWSAAPDGVGGVFVAGETQGSLGGPIAGDYDAWLARYDGAGNQTWIVQVGTSVYDVLLGAEPDGAGGVFVAGQTFGSLGGPAGGNGDAWLAHYDGAGNQQWILQVGTSGEDWAMGTARDGAGGFFVSGFTLGNLGGPNAGNGDAWLAHHDGAGNLDWIQQLGTSSYDDGRTAAPDGVGGVHVSGITSGSLGGPYTGGLSDVWLARYDSPCGAVSSYCTASTTSIAGCQAAIFGTGTPSLANPSGFSISSGSIPGGNLGICFFSENGAASVPFGSLGGQICMQTPLFRSAPALTGGTSGLCDGALVYTLQDLIDASPIITLGNVIHAEIWGRDPANPDTFLLSDGLRFTVCP